MKLDKRLSQIEDRLKQSGIISQAPHTLAIPKETWIGALRILMDAGVKLDRDYLSSADQLAKLIYRGTFNQANE